MRSRVQANLPPMEVISVDSRVSPAVTEGDREREWMDLVVRALARTGMLHKRAAAEMGTDRGQFAAQLACAPNRHLSFRKMWKLPPEFWRELILQIADFHEIAIGASQRDADDAAIGRIVREVVTRCR